jgi:hypothetical protein
MLRGATRMRFVPTFTCVRFYERLNFVFILLATHFTAQKDGVTNDLSFYALISVVMEYLSDAVLLL